MDSKYSSVNIQFTPVTPTVLYSWTANTVYTFNGNQDPANNFNKSLTTVSGCRIPVSIPSTFTLEFEVDNLAPQNSLEFIFNIGIMFKLPYGEIICNLFFRATKKNG